MLCVAGPCRDGNGWAWFAVIVDDDGNHSAGAVPESADAHGRNSSRAV
jgi:hypothetical protein